MSSSLSIVGNAGQITGQTTSSTRPPETTADGPNSFSQLLESLFSSGAGATAVVPTAASTVAIGNDQNPDTQSPSAQAVPEVTASTVPVANNTTNATFGSNPQPVLATTSVAAPTSFGQLLESLFPSTAEPTAAPTASAPTAAPAVAIDNDQGPNTQAPAATPGVTASAGPLLDGVGTTTLGPNPQPVLATTSVAAPTSFGQLLESLFPSTAEPTTAPTAIVPTMAPAVAIDNDQNPDAQAPAAAPGITAAAGPVSDKLTSIVPPAAGHAAMAAGTTQDAPVLAPGAPSRLLQQISPATNAPAATIDTTTASSTTPDASASPAGESFLDTPAARPPISTPGAAEMSGAASPALASPESVSPGTPSAGQPAHASVATAGQLFDTTPLANGTPAGAVATATMPEITPSLVSAMPSSQPSTAAQPTDIAAPAVPAATPSAPPARGFATPSAAAAALLDAAPSSGAASAPANANPTAVPAASTLIGALKSLFGKTTRGTTGITSEAPAATMSPDGTSSDAGTPPALLRNVVSTLTELDKAEQQGVVPSKQLLKQAQHAVEALSAFLASQQPAAVPLATQPSTVTPGQAAAGNAVAALGTTPGAAGISALGPPSDSSAAVTGPASDGSDPGGEATTNVDTELSQLSDKLQALSSSVGKDQPDLGADLGQLARLLDPKTLAPATATQLGFASNGAPAAPELAAAIDGLVHGKAAPVLGQPSLAAPVLKAASDLTSAKPTAGNTANTFASAATDKGSAATRAETPTQPDTDPKAGKPDDAQKPIAAAPQPTEKLVAAAISPSNPSDGTASAATPAPSLPTPTTTADLRQAQAAYRGAEPTPINLPQMAFEIARHAQQGSDQFQISMDPKDLGRVDVKLAIDNTTGAVTAHLTADRPETLDLLKRDAGTLGQALAQAGLDAGKTNLQFSLNQNPFTRQDGGGNAAPSPPADDDFPSGQPAAAPVAVLYQGTASSSGLNIFV